MTKYQGLPTEIARHYQSGGLDAYGNAPERCRSEGTGNPCRYCLKPVPEGAEMLIVAHRPFGALQPYAETGPIFLCAEACEAPRDARALPEVLGLSPSYLIKGYTEEERIFYGTGEVVAQEELQAEIAARLERAEVAFVDVRSARNNCWLLRAVPGRG